MKTIKNKFKDMGARVKFGPAEKRRGFNASGTIPFTIDVSGDKRGEHFQINHNEEVKVEVSNIDKKDRHLVLKAGGETFLCGHDEMHWFVAAVHGSASTVEQAKNSLKPEEVIQAEARTKVRRKNRHKRHNKAFKRQGEWFFTPVTDEDRVLITGKVIHKNEPISRGASPKPHIVRELVRAGGERVWVRRPQLRFNREEKGLNRMERDEGEVISEKEYRKRVKSGALKHEGQWSLQVADARVFARGTIKHPDHKTIKLDDWHLVSVNGEIVSENVRFID